MKRRLHLMVGLPRSGKTTRALELGYPIVCPDAIRLAIHGQAFIPEAEPVVWAHAKIMARALFLAGHNDVTIDATNTTFKRREFWIEEDSRSSITLSTPELLSVFRELYLITVRSCALLSSEWTNNSRRLQNELFIVAKNGRSCLASPAIDRRLLLVGDPARYRLDLGPGHLCNDRRQTAADPGGIFRDPYDLPAVNGWRRGEVYQ